MITYCSKTIQEVKTKEKYEKIERAHEQKRKCERLQGRTSKIPEAAPKRKGLKNLEGNPLYSSSNSFHALDDEDFVHRALEMGVKFDDYSLEKISILTVLEKDRSNSTKKQKGMSSKDNELESKMAP